MQGRRRRHFYLWVFARVLSTLKVREHSVSSFSYGEAALAPRCSEEGACGITPLCARGHGTRLFSIESTVQWQSS